VPAAVSVVIPDDYHATLYAVAISGALLLAAWWLVNNAYVRSRSAAQAARRAALLTGGLAEPLSATEMSALRERFTVTADTAKRYEKQDYYATDLPPGHGRIAEMLEESALYSERYQDTIHLHLGIANNDFGISNHPTDEGSAAFSDTPTALKTIFGRMDDFLQLNLTKPAVTNPYLPNENFAHAWTDDQYANFRTRIHTYREWIDDAFDEQSRAESIAKWRRVVGADFASGVVLREGKSAVAP
jgi:hypothetical protein